MTTLLTLQALPSTPRQSSRGLGDTADMPSSVSMLSISPVSRGLSPVPPSACVLLSALPGGPAAYQPCLVGLRQLEVEHPIQRTA